MKLSVATVAAIMVLAPTLVPVQAIPADSVIGFEFNPLRQWNQNDGTTQGVTFDGTNLWVTTSDFLIQFSTTGTKGCSTNVDNADGGGTNGQPAYHDGFIYIPRKTGQDSTAYTTIATYDQTCTYRGSIDLGVGMVEALTYHRGAFYGAWRNDEIGTGYLKKYDLSFSTVKSWYLSDYYYQGSFVGPNGLAFYGDFMLTPLHALANHADGVQIWRFPGEGDPVLVDTITYPRWRNSAAGDRLEIGSQGLFIVDDFDDGANPPYAWFVGRDRYTGNGDGFGGIAKFELTPTLGTHTWFTPPVTYGALDEYHDQNQSHLQGIATDASHVYVLKSEHIEKWTHGGVLVDSRNVSTDHPNLRLGGGTVEDGFLYVYSSDYPAIPRTGSILKYRTSDLGLELAKDTAGGYGSGGGVGFHSGHILFIKNLDDTGVLKLQRYDPATLDMVDDVSMGYYHEVFHQGIETISLGSTVYIYAPHHDPQDPYGKPGIHIWRSDNDAISWDYEGSAAYTTWANDNDGRTDINSQDIEFGCVNGTPYVWSAGRWDAEGNKYASWARHAANDPSGYIDCPAAALANLTVAANVYDAAGNVAGTSWSFTAAAGAVDVDAETFLKVTNAGDAAGSLRVALGDFAGPASGVVPTSDNVAIRYGIGASPDAVASWSTVQGDASGAADVPVDAGASLWLQYRLASLPAVLQDGAYSATLTHNQL